MVVLHRRRKAGRAARNALPLQQAVAAYIMLISRPWAARRPSAPPGYEILRDKPAGMMFCTRPGGRMPGTLTRALWHQRQGSRAGFGEPAPCDKVMQDYFDT